MKLKRTSLVLRPKCLIISFEVLSGPWDFVIGSNSIALSISCSMNGSSNAASCLDLILCYSLFLEELCSGVSSYSHCDIAKHFI